MLFMWNLNSTKFFITGSKLFLLINYTFYSNLNSTNFSCYLCETHLIDGKLFLLINYIFYSNLNSTNLHVIYVEFLLLFIGGKLFLLINYIFYSNLNSTNFSCYLCGI